MIRRLVGTKFGQSVGTHKMLTLVMGFSADGQKVVTGSNDSEFKIWSRKSGDLESVLKGHKTRALEAVFSPDGSFIATSDWDDHLKVWNVEGGELVWSIKLKGWPYFLQFDPSSKQIFALQELNRATILDARSGQEIWSEKGIWMIEKTWTFLATYAKSEQALKVYRLVR